MLARATDNEVPFELSIDGVVSAPHAVSWALLDASGNTLATGAAAIVSGVPVASIDAVDLPTSLSFGAGYRMIWDVTHADGDTPERIPVAVYLARYSLMCPVAQSDLEAEYPDIGSMLGPDVAHLQSFLGAAWSDVLRSMSNDGLWPHEVVDVDRLFTWVRELAFEKVWRNAMVHQPSYASHYEAHRDAARAAKAAMRTRVDRDQDGIPDDDDHVGTGLGLLRPSIAPRGRRRVL